MGNGFGAAGVTGRRFPTEAGPLGNARNTVEVVIGLGNEVRSVWSLVVVPDEEGVPVLGEFVDERQGVVGQKLGDRGLGRAVEDAVAGDFLAIFRAGQNFAAVSPGSQPLPVFRVMLSAFTMTGKILSGATTIGWKGVIGAMLPLRRQPIDGVMIAAHQGVGSENETGPSYPESEKIAQLETAQDERRPL